MTVSFLLPFIVLISIQTAPCDLSAPGSRDGSFFPDGRHIVFASSETGNHEIYRMRADGSGRRRLTRSSLQNYYPFVSPDGSRIVFMSFEGARASIRTMDADGSNTKTILSDSVHTFADPSWSNDGTRILYYTDQDGNDEVYMSDADGSNTRRLTNHPASEQTPSMSPDGERIVFVSDRAGSADIYSMRVDGSGVERLTTGGGIDRVPRWSHDGRKIYWYIRANPADAGSSELSWRGAELWEMNADGTGKRPLTANGVPDQSPVPSPDGTEILFTSCRTGNRDLFVIRSDGTGIRRLTTTPR